MSCTCSPGRLGDFRVPFFRYSCFEVADAGEAVKDEAAAAAMRGAAKAKAPEGTQMPEAETKDHLAIETALANKQTVSRCRM